MATVPTHTVAVRLHRHLPKQMPEWTEEVLKNHLIVEKVPIPPLNHGQLLVKNERAPINPVDLLIISRQYSKHFAEFPLPMIPGYEGDGTVIAEGGGFEWLVGKRVAARGHMWTEYSVIEGTAAVPLPDDVNWEEGSSVLINPLTVIGMIKIALDRGVNTIVHTAAASALGKMLIRYGKTKGVQVIGVVRKEQQVKECKEAGATHVFNLNDINFDEQLKNIALKENATLAFDAIGGEITGRLLADLPHGSEVQIYGNLSLEKASGISWGDLVFERKKLSGYWLTELMKDPAFVAYAYQQIPQLMKGEFATKVAKTFLLEDIHSAIIYYLGHMTEGKCLLNLSANRRSA